MTVILGAIFTMFQAYEYMAASFKITSGIYGSTFYMATGFHGFHVLVGTIFLFVCWFRARANHYTSDHHFGFEAAAWYWHFVDVVGFYLLLFIFGAVNNCLKKNLFNLFVIFIILLLFSLGSWQLKRLSWKTNLIANISNSFNSSPIQISANIKEFDKIKFNGTIIGEPISVYKLGVNGSYDLIYITHY